MRKYGTNTIGEGIKIFDPVILGFPSREYLNLSEFPGAIIGNDAILRSGTIIYSDVVIGDNFSTGHNVIIREKTKIGNDVSIGTASVIEGQCTIGNRISIQSMVFIPTGCTIGNDVFIGPNTILTNDRYPPSGKSELIGPVIEDKSTIGANVTILPGVRIGYGSTVAAGALVTKDVPPGVLAIGSPARIKALPKELRRI
jgi:acetyltransferase-like isoleucine patch superfamily enzyme